MSKQDGVAAAGDLVIMLLSDLSKTPSHALPAGLPFGYRLRSFVPGDQQTWVRIQSASDAYNAISPGLFTSEFGQDDLSLAERQFYITDEGGEAVGTVTAWSPAIGVDPKCGRLHWLAVIPPRQRQGLGACLVATALRRLRELGYQRAYLTSSLLREGALRLYRRFGFRLVSDDEWRRSGIP